MNNWNKCQICGQFIALNDFVDGLAVHRLLEPDSDLSTEKYETHHNVCAEQENEKQNQEWWQQIDCDQEWINNEIGNENGYDQI